MYSKLRRKLNITIICIIIPMVIGSLLTQSTRAEWVLEDNEAVVYPARSGPMPNLDGVVDASWDSIKKFKENTQNPPLELRMKFNATSGFVYCLIIVKNDTHSDNESVLLMLSNNGTTLTDPKYFVDAKYADINNRTEDRRRQAGNYVPDDVQSITGKMGFQRSGGLINYSVYEFGFSYNNTDPNLDTIWNSYGKTYAAKIRLQDEVAGWTIDSYPMFGIEFGVAGGEPNDTISPFDLDVKLLTWIAFITVGGIYGILGVYVSISKSKAIVVPKGRAPEEIEQEDATESTPEESTGDAEDAEDMEEE